MSKIDYNVVFESILKLKDEAGKLLESGENNLAIEKYKEAIIRSNIILKRAKTKSEQFDLNYLLGAFYRRVGLLSQSISHAKKATIFDESSERASLSLYLCYVDSKEYDKAIDEIYRYCKRHQISLYKTTINELYNDFKDGYLPKYEGVINELIEIINPSNKKE